MELMAAGMAKMEAKSGVNETRGLFATKVANCFGCHNTGALAAAGDNKWMTV